MASRVENADSHQQPGSSMNSVEPMMAFYPHIKLFHIICVIASGTLFALRGGAVLAGAQWPMTAPARLFSYAIDTLLLTAAMMLLTILPSAMFANGWLIMKMCLLMAYIVLGSFALKRARKARMRAICFACALCVYLLMISVAYWHHPLGVFANLSLTHSGVQTKMR